MGTTLVQSNGLSSRFLSESVAGAAILKTNESKSARSAIAEGID